MRNARTFVYLILFVAFVTAGLVSWQQLSELSQRLTTISELTRFDEWSLNELNQDVARLEAAIAFAVVMLDEPSFENLLDRLDIAWSRITPVTSGAKGGLLRQTSQRLPGLITELEHALSRVDELVLAADGSQLDRQFLIRIRDILRPVRIELSSEISRLLQAQLASQDRNINAIRDSVRLNWQTVIFCIAAGTLLFSLIALETRNVKRARKIARASEVRFRAFARSSSDWLWETDDKGILTYVSGGGATSANLDVEAWKGETFIGRCIQAQANDRPVNMTSLFSNGESWRDVIATFEFDDRNRRFMRLSGEPIRDPKLGIVGFRGSMSDITEQVEQDQRIRFLAEHDALTGLPNRNRLMLVLDDLLLKLSSTQAVEVGRDVDLGPSSYVVMLMDLDGFKAINDTFGHDVGDALLIDVSDRLQNIAPPEAILARLGGDEFCMVVGDTGERVLTELAARLVDAVRRPKVILGQKISVGTSIGAARLPADASDVSGILKAADLALYRAKSSNRGQLVTFRKEFSNVLQRRTRIEQALRGAIAERRLRLAYQPIFRVESRSIVGAEALVRWHDDEFGWVSPAEFISISEETGLILPLGERVLEEGIRVASEWPEELFVSINISPAQFQHGNLTNKISRIVKRYGFPPERLQIEITEGLLVTFDEHREALTSLVDLGCRLAIDDFGTGYSSLAYLNRLPIHHVKIDGRFVRYVDDDPSDRTVASAMLAMFAELGMSVTAECVETESQLSFVKARGCEFAQGYLVAKPMSASDFKTFIIDQGIEAMANERARTLAF